MVAPISQSVQPATTSTPRAAPLFERLGGQPAVDAAVATFYEKVLADVQLKRFFEGVDLAKLKRHQTAFMTMAFGGTKAYSGRTMAAAHSRLIRDHGLNASHFDLVAGHLVSSLQDLSVAPELIQEVVAVVGPLRSVFEAPGAAVAGDE